mgnify:CR=1 FL=1
MPEKKNILVYAHWVGMKQPKLMGTLIAQQGKGSKAFSFEYSPEWLQSQEQLLLDPHIGWYSGTQYNPLKENFGIFLDSMPDTWGRTLMKRRAALLTAEGRKPARTLHDVDFLLGVYDKTRMGALRFKLDKDGPFLDDCDNMPAPPWNTAAELQKAADMIETDKNVKTIKKWLAILIAPGSSLGGARPKANITDKRDELWIAKFPSKNDTIDKAAWEFLAYKLALKCGVEMAESKLEKISGRHHTFFTKRFDRYGEERIHFASAMTMTGYNEDTIRDNTASYLDIAEFIQYHGAQNIKDMEQLWRRIIFHIAISNTDDHLGNHGFLLTKKGWILSPAFDINPSVDKTGLALNIDTVRNDLDFELAKSVGEYFRLTNTQMNNIIQQVTTVVNSWKRIAVSIGISKAEIELMSAAFKNF